MGWPGPGTCSHLLSDTCQLDSTLPALHQLTAALCPVCRAWAADNPGNFYKEMPEYEATTHYLLIYMGVVIAFVCLLLVRDGAFSVWSIRASTNLHNRLFRSVLGAPILFFLRTPLGDVLNAFARDQVRTDESQRRLQLCMSAASTITDIA